MGMMKTVKGDPMASPLKRPPLPRVEPDPAFMQELAATAKAHAPLAAQEKKTARRAPKGTWQGLALGLASVMAFFAFGGLDVLTGHEDSGLSKVASEGSNLIENGPSAADSGSTGRHSPSTSPNYSTDFPLPTREEALAQCTMEGASVFTYLGCLLQASVR